jgi:hypothetical protein
VVSKKLEMNSHSPMKSGVCSLSNAPQKTKSHTVSCLKFPSVWDGSHHSPDGQYRPMLLLLSILGGLLLHLHNKCPPTRIRGVAFGQVSCTICSPPAVARLCEIVLLGIAGKETAAHLWDI